MAILKNRRAPVVFFLIVSVFCQVLVYLVDAGDYVLSVIYSATSLVSMKMVWDYSNKRVTLFLLFLVAYHLFIGGRFFYYLFSQENPIFILEQFTYYEPKGLERLKIFLFVYMFVALSTVGFCFCQIKERRPRFIPQVTSREKQKMDKVLNKLVPLFVVFLIYEGYSLITVSLQNVYGTLALNSNAEDNVSYLVKFARLSIITMSGLAIAYGEKKTIYKYLSLLLAVGLIDIISGSRGTFGSFLLFLIWVYAHYRKVSLGRLVVYGSAGLASILVLFSFSSRAITSGFLDLSPADALKDFIYGNGVSLMVFGVSITVGNYPIYPYFQQFILGSNFIISHLTGVHLKPEEISFQGHLCNTLDSNLYYSGAGLGWSVNGDLYLFSGGNILIYCFLSYCLGFLISYIDASSRKSSFYLFMACAIGYFLFMVPRGSTSAIFVMFYYVYLYFYLTKYLTRFV